MFICMYVCMHLCVYVCMCVCVYMCICMYAFMCVCVYVCMCVCMYVRTYSGITSLQTEESTTAPGGGSVAITPLLMLLIGYTQVVQQTDVNGDNGMTRSSSSHLGLWPRGAVLRNVTQHRRRS